jgi:Tfp pilus assembly protein PilF
MPLVVDEVAMTMRTVRFLSLAGGLFAVLAAGGCASMKSPGNWFKPKSPVEAASTSQGAGGIASAISSTGKGISNQFKSMGSAVSSAYSKTKSVVTSPFANKKPGSEDPTSLSHMPTNLGPEIWVTNGQLYETQGNFAKALDNYTKALELEPTNQAALISTARLYERQSQHEKATDFFHKAIAVKPEASTFNELAMAYNGLGRQVEAQEAVRQAIRMDPANARYRNNLAGMLVAEGRSDDAVANLQEIFPPAVANYNVAYLHFSNKNIAAAQQHLQTAMQLDPNLTQARELSNQIASNPATQSAVAVYQAAGNIYRTAEATVSPTVQANQAILQAGANAVGTPSAPTIR